MSTQDELAGLSDAVREAVARCDKRAVETWTDRAQADYDTLRAELIRLSKPVEDEVIAEWCRILRADEYDTPADLIERLARRVQELEDGYSRIGVMSARVLTKIGVTHADLKREACDVLVDAFQAIERERDAEKQRNAALAADLEAARTRANTLAQEAQGLRDALDSIRVYGEDTLSGPVETSDLSEWFSEGVREMVRRTFIARGSEETKA